MRRFYRYEPNGKQTVQVFPIPEINLDLRRSKMATNLFVQELDIASSGVIKCEVSAERTFLTVSREQMMKVMSNGSSLIHLDHLMIIWCVLLRKIY